MTRSPLVEEAKVPEVLFSLELTSVREPVSVMRDVVFWKEAVPTFRMEFSKYWEAKPLPPTELPYTEFLTIRVVGSSVTEPPVAMEFSKT